MIKLTDQYSIDRDKEFWTVYKLTKVKGKPYWRPTWYYPNLKSLIEGLLETGFVIPADMNQMVDALDAWGAEILKELSRIENPGGPIL